MTKPRRKAPPQPIAMGADGSILEPFAVRCGNPGDYYVADPAAPLEHGCSVVVRIAPKRWQTEGKLHTKRPARAKTLAVEFEGWSIQRGLERSSVVRVVGRFTAAKWLRDPVPSEGRASPALQEAARAPRR